VIFVSFCEVKDQYYILIKLLLIIHINSYTVLDNSKKANYTQEQKKNTRCEKIQTTGKNTVRSTNKTRIVFKCKKQKLKYVGRRKVLIALSSPNESLEGYKMSASEMKL
jgi:hypothetical protein